MITKNGGAIMTIFAQTGAQSWSFKDKSGTAFTANVTYGGTFMKKAETSQDEGAWARLGSGDTEPTADDYKLAQEVNIPCVSASLAVVDRKAVYTYSFLNNTAQAITVSEMGLFSFISGYYNNQILVARKLIPSRTIQPNENVTFSYVVEFN
ncbi:MAG: hypothetical protein K6F27_00250 [Ruminococcus sp.]|nr:hypothetical protein [Ruminococcus sp.]